MEKSRLSPVCPGAIVWGEGGKGAIIIGGDKGNAKITFDVVEYKENMSLIMERLNDKTGEGLTTSQADRLKKMLDEGKKALEEQLPAVGVEVKTKLTDADRANAIVQLIIGSKQLAEEIRAENQQRMDGGANIPAPNKTVGYLIDKVSVWDPAKGEYNQINQDGEHGLYSKGKGDTLIEYKADGTKIYR